MTWLKRYWLVLLGGVGSALGLVAYLARWLQDRRERRRLKTTARRALKDNARLTRERAASIKASAEARARADVAAADARAAREVDRATNDTDLVGHLRDVDPGPR